MPLQTPQSRKLFFGVLVDDARDVGRIDDDRALLLENGDGFGHRLRLLGVQARRVPRRRAA